MRRYENETPTDAFIRMPKAGRSFLSRLRDHWRSGLADAIVDAPTMVYLCGSTRFKGAWLEALETESLAGRITLSVPCFGHQPGEEITPGEKLQLDQLHMRKIDFANEVLVIDVGGYIGESTRREIAYAIVRGKPIRYQSHDERAPTVPRST